MIGVDEAGRGAWAGPLVAAAVFLKKPVIGLKDSKVLTRLQRQQLATKIQANGRVGIGWVSPLQIDEIGLTAATSLAMRRALAQVHNRDIKVLIDGNFNYLRDEPLAETLVDADALVPVVSAASIIAKVARDNFMIEISAKFPLYGFENHVGYGTRFHLEMLKLHGICDLHRRSYKPIRVLI